MRATSTGGWRLRPLTPADRADVHRLQRDTLVLGRPLPVPVMDLDHLLGFFLDYYVLIEPEFGVIVEADDGVAVGFGLGSADAHRRERWMQRRAAAVGWRWLTRWPRYDAFTKAFYRRRLADAREVLDDPPVKPSAVMHWSVLPTVRGRVMWTMLRHFRDAFAARGLATFGGEYPLVLSRNSPDSWLRLNIQPVHQAPHHTLTWLLGEPVQRLVLHVDIATVRV